jgi:hypothetical protein
MVSIASTSLDAFRIGYQGVEAAFQKPIQTPYNPTPPQQFLILRGQLPTVAQKIYQRLNINIAVADAILTSIQTFSSNTIADYIVPFRVASIAQGLYILETDPTADREEVKFNIYLNFLNISRTALSVLSRAGSSGPSQQFLTYASLGCQVGDAAIRLYRVISNRAAISDRIDEIRQDGIYSYLTGGFDIIARNKDALILNPFILYTNLYTYRAYTALTFGTAALGMHILVKMAANKIFDHHNVPHGNLRRLAAFSISALSSTAIVSAAAVGTGYATSFSAIFKPIYKTAAPVTLAATLTYLFVTGLEYLGNVFQVNNSETGSLAKWTFSIVSASILASAAAVGLGMNQTQTMLLEQILTVINTFSITYFFFMTGSLLIHGIPPKFMDDYFFVDLTHLIKSALP